MSSLYDLSNGCALCRVCEGAAYQAPPALFAGNPEAKILAIGQNPGEIKSGDTREVWTNEIFHMLPDDIVSAAMPVWYTWDFSTSPGYRRLSTIFGNDWLQEGKILWTNAVRCRTKGNAAPSKEMLDSCSVWTNSLLNRVKAIIMVGAVARSQILGEEAHRLSWGSPRKSKRFGYVLAIKHYSAWRNEVPSYKEAVSKIMEVVYS